MLSSSPRSGAAALLRYVTILVAVLLAACAQERKVSPCSTPAHRQFDFWLGEWEVSEPSGKLAGRNEITSLHDGCVVFESWRGAGGVTGMSLNVYDAEHRKWKQTWVDSTGGVLELEGVFADGRMVLVSAIDKSVNRVTWQSLPEGGVRQHWEASEDGGVTWKTVFEGYYKKR